MADTKISGLTALTAPAGTDEFAIVDDDANATKKITVANLLAGIEDATSAITTGYAGTDTLLVIDGGTAKYTTYANILAGIEDALSAIGAAPATTDTLLLVDGGTAKTVTVANLHSGLQGRGRVSLPVTAAHLPDDSAGSAAAQIQKKTSSDATDPQLFWVEALFDADADEHIYYQFLMPDNYASAPIVDVYYKCASATEGDAAFGAMIAAVTDADAADMDANKLDAANVGTATVPGTAGYMDVISITMTNADSVAANDFVILCVFRDISGDSVAADIEVPLVVLRYTST